MMRGRFEKSVLGKNCPKRLRNGNFKTTVAGVFECSRDCLNFQAAKAAFRFRKTNPNSLQAVHCSTFHIHYSSFLQSGDYLDLQSVEQFAGKHCGTGGRFRFVYQNNHFATIGAAFGQPVGRRTVGRCILALAA
jgi:hypothetical protein